MLALSQFSLTFSREIGFNKSFVNVNDFTGITLLNTAESCYLKRSGGRQDSLELEFEIADSTANDRRSYPSAMVMSSK